jgi:hypothetical protein
VLDCAVPDATVLEESGGQVDYGGLPVHTHALLPPDQYFKDHPEYAGRIRQALLAQLCATNPDVAHRYRKRPPFSPKTLTPKLSAFKNDNDGNQICHCERCEKLRGRGGEMANQLVLANHVAEAVEKTHPGIGRHTAYIETIGVLDDARAKTSSASATTRQRVDVPSHLHEAVPSPIS